MNKKILLGLLAANACAAELTTMIGANLELGVLKPAISSEGLVNVDSKDSDGVVGKINASYTVGGVEVDGTKTKLADANKIMPIGGSIVARVIAGDEFKFGAGISVGGRYYEISAPKDRFYGAVDGKAQEGAEGTLPIAFQYPKGSLVLNPHFLMCFDVNDIKVLLSAGLDMSYHAVNVLWAKGSTATDSTGAQLGRSVEVKNWLFGIKLGVEGVYNVTPCVGVGAGVSYTYLPKSWNKMNQAGKKAQFLNATATTSAKDEVLNLGGTWAVTLNLAAYITPSAVAA